MIQWMKAMKMIIITSKMENKNVIDIEKESGREAEVIDMRE